MGSRFIRHSLAWLKAQPGLALASCCATLWVELVAGPRGWEAGLGHADGRVASGSLQVQQRKPL